MQVTFTPSAASGVLTAPPSKSMAHRLLIGAALSSGESKIRGVENSEDVLATLECLEQMGAKINRVEKDAVQARGFSPLTRTDVQTLFCRESGSTLRFLIPLALLSASETQFSGSPMLMARPLSVYETICREQALLFVRNPEGIRVRGPLRPGVFTVPGNVSSQFLSGLLFALPLLSEESTIRILLPLESSPYLELTLQALRAFGITVRRPDAETLQIPGGQHYESGEFQVEGDYSGAAFFDAFNFAGGSVTVKGLSPDSLQGDRVCRDYFAALAAGNAALNLSDCPDLAPVLFVASALHHGGVFTGTGRLKWKESDRGQAMAEELFKCGVRVTIEADRITVAPENLHAPAEPLSGHNDHRVVMALSVLLSRLGGTLNGAEAVRKSMPDFFTRLRSLGISCTVR